MVTQEEAERWTWNGGRSGKFALLDSDRHFSNSLEIAEVPTPKSRKPKVSHSMPCMTYDSSVKVRQ